MKKFITIALLVFLILGMYFYFKNLPSNAKQVFVPNRQCPESWFSDKMPMIGEETINSEYMIVDGKRTEMYEMDVEWIKENCEVNKPLSVF